ncbi:sulfatase-like hydrolase/transferase [Haloarculaceae archaeon H-GB1-1]|nr:sulfatase-like hydrolase/transferase [Haloarculaceae archaeon H-GB1-1]
MEIDVHVDPTNIYIFVADALRWDSVPQRLADESELIKTVSSSPLSCTAFTSILTGLNPPKHGVWKFSDVLPDDIDTIFDLVPGSCPTYMMNTISQGIDGVDRYSERAQFHEAIANVQEPFVVMDRELSTHAPYGYDMSHPEIPDEDKSFTSLSEYWTARTSDRTKIRRDYNRSAETAIDRFEERIDILRQRGVLEDTLVILTADHGEVLGEYGMYGHAPTLVSESVYVPTLFYGDGVEVTADGDFMAHVDLYPTLCALMDEPVPEYTSGYNLIEGAPDSRLVFNAKKIDATLLSKNLEYHAFGAWDHDGGHAFSDFGLTGKLLSVANRLVRTDDAPLNRRRPFTVLRTCFNRERTFGSPEHDRTEARRYCEQMFSDEIQSQSQTLDEAAQDRLDALGYTDGEIG